MDSRTSSGQEGRNCSAIWRLSVGLYQQRERFRPERLSIRLLPPAAKSGLVQRAQQLPLDGRRGEINDDAKFALAFAGLDAYENWYGRGICFRRFGVRGGLLAAGPVHGRRDAFTSATMSSHSVSVRSSRSWLPNWNRSSV